MKVGIVGGTFDPIHIAHLLSAEEARSSLELEEVVFIPTGESWMKADKPISPSHHRLNMARLATNSNPYFRVSSMEIDRPGPTYTVDTLEELHQENEPGTQFYMILGLDSMLGFARWKEPARILELCNLVLVPRSGYDEYDITALDNLRPGASGQVSYIDFPRVDISSTNIRQRISQGQTVRYQVPREVESYMDRYGLYRDGR